MLQVSSMADNTRPHDRLVLGRARVEHPQRIEAGPRHVVVEAVDDLRADIRVAFAPRQGLERHRGQKRAIPGVVTQEGLDRIRLVAEQLHAALEDRLVQQVGRVSRGVVVGKEVRGQLPHVGGHLETQPIETLREGRSVGLDGTCTVNSQVGNRVTQPPSKQSDKE